MTQYGSPDVAFVLLGGRSIMGDIIEIVDSQEGVNEETTALGASVDSWAAVGVKRFEAILRGIYSDSGVVTALEVATAQALMYGLEGNTLGKEFTGLTSVRTQIVRSSTRDALHRLEATFKANQGMDQGVILAPLVARDSGDTPLTAVDNAAASSNGSIGYLGVSAITLGGYDSVTIKIRDAAVSTYGDHITFANIAAVPAFERLTVAGEVLRNARIETTWNGAGSGESITFAVGFIRG